MKRLFPLFMFAIVATLSLSSCSDDDDTKTDNFSITGRWVYEKATVEVKTNSTTNDKIISEDMIKNLIQDYDNQYIELNADGTFTTGFVDNSETPEKGTYIQTENKITLLIPILNDTDKNDDRQPVKKIDLTLENNKLTFNNNNYNAEYYNNLELNELIKLGVTGIKDNTFKVEKTKSVIYFKK